jgi:hypothetical protein
MRNRILLVAGLFLTLGLAYALGATAPLEVTYYYLPT